MVNKNLPVVYKMEEEYCIPKTWEFTKPQNEAAGADRMMELLWQNGPVVMQSPNIKPPKKTDLEVVHPAQKVIRFGGDLPQNLYVQEDEMASWLQIPLDYSSFDLLYSVHPPSTPLAAVAPTRVTAEIYPAPPLLSPEAPVVTQLMQNFMLFSKIPPEPPAEESTVVESNETPKVRPPGRPRISHSSVQLNVASAACTSATARELAGGTFEHTVTTSPGGSRASFSASGEEQQRPASVVAVDSKRKAVEENDDSRSQSEDIDFEAAEAKKQSGGSKSTKRSRAAEVHNLSERRRRDRINEKMRTLKELLPRCNKVDKASLLDEVIEYLKSLKMQVQMLAMGWSIMYPNMQQYMPPMGMGMNRPMVAYPSVMGPRFPMPPPSHMRQVPVADPSRAQPSNQTDKQPQMSNHVDLYQQLLNMQQTQLSQNQVAPQTDLKKASTSKNDPNKPSTSKNPGNLKNHDQHFG